MECEKCIYFKGKRIPFKSHCKLKNSMECIYDINIPLEWVNKKILQAQKKLSFYRWVICNNNIKREEREVKEKYYFLSKDNDYLRIVKQKEKIKVLKEIKLKILNKKIN